MAQVKTIDELAAQLGVDAAATQALLDAQGVALGDVDAVVLGLLKSEVSGKVSARPKTRSNGSNGSALAKAGSEPQSQPKTVRVGSETAQNAAALLFQADTAVSTMYARSAEIASEVVDPELEKAAQEIGLEVAKVTLDSISSAKEALIAFLSKSGSDSLAAIDAAAVQRGLLADPIDAEFVEN